MTRVATTLIVTALLAPSTALARAHGRPARQSYRLEGRRAADADEDQISATVARQIVDACVDFARNQQGGPGNYAIFVLAPNGDIVDAHVMDGVMPIGVETGLLKAKTALYARTPSTPSRSVSATSTAA